MSVRTGFAIVGAAVGAYFGNAALGYSIGSMIGGYVDPLQVKGPRIDDAQNQTSQDGVPIPITYGSVRIAGNIIAKGNLVEHKKTDDGKGSGTETTTYTYTRTYAIGICEGPVAGIRRIWRDAKLVYDARVGMDNGLAHAASSKFKQNADIYMGTEDQMPNSALQALFGESLVPAFRGLAYMVVRDDDLTDRGGSIPIYEFEVVQYASSSTDGDYAVAQYTDPLWYSNALSQIDPRIQGATYEYGCSQAGAYLGTQWFTTMAAAGQAINDIYGRGVPSDIKGWSYDFKATGGNGDGPTGGYAPYRPPSQPPINAYVLGLVCAMTTYSTEVDQITYDQITPEVVGGGLYSARIGSAAYPDLNGSGVITNEPRTSTSSTLFLPSGTFYLSSDEMIAVRPSKSCTIIPADDWVPIPGTTDYYVSPDGQIHFAGECEAVAGDFKQMQNESFSGDHLVLLDRPLGPALQVGSPLDTEEFWTAAYNQLVLMGSMPPGYTYGVQYPVYNTQACFCEEVDQIDPTYPTLAEIVADLCYRKGLTASDIDVSQLTDTVKGFTVATVTSAAGAINALAPAYHFDEAEWDGKIRFIKRGGPTLAALNEQDAFDSDNGRIIETRAQELELPRKLSLAYMDIGADYAITTQSAERLSATVASSGIDLVQLSVVMEYTKAAQTADILLKDQWSSINGTLEISVGDEYSRIVPTDPLFLSYEDALFRCRVVEASNADGIVKLNLQQDNAGAYGSVAVGVPPRPSEEGNQTIIGPTFLEVLNLPALRDKDDQVGLYIAACGPVGTWDGAQIAVSLDEGQTWRDTLVVRQSSTMGQLVSPLDIWSEFVPDTEHDILVQLTSGDFESITLDQMYRDGNPLCVGEEITQFQTADQDSAGFWELDGTLFRGRKNTDPSTWPAGTRAVLLSDVYFMPLDRSYIGRNLQIRATSLGTDVQYGTIKTIQFDVPKSVQEWPVTNVQHERAVDESLSVSWLPRHRLGTSANPYPSTSFVGYRLVFTDGTTTRTFDTLNRQFEYTAAQQTADFGGTGLLSLTIYALNSIIGPGEGYTVTV